jgi:2-polyprenyl-6-methoxyphenol hydroxylase-like FAD-dependent oxidoreductase
MGPKGSDAAVEVPVLIVGAGPTGLVASILLSRFGVPSLTVERHPGTSIYPRAIAINTRSMEIFRGFGVEERIRAAGFSAEACVARSSTLIDPDPEKSPPLGTPPTDISPTQWTTCSQFALEPILLDEATSRPGTWVWFNAELTSFEQYDDGVRAWVVDRQTGHRTEVRSRYMIAADGANSLVRRELGIELMGHGVLGHNVAIHFRAPLIDRLPHRPIFLHFVENDRARGLMFTTDGAYRWVFNAGYDPEKGESPADFSSQRAVQLIRDGSGVADLDVEVRAMLPWELHGDMAAREREGNVFLAGDAAHRMTPAGGLGMNTGIQDAHNLAWKLAAVLHGWADPSLLDTYEAERRPVAQANVDRSVFLSQNGVMKSLSTPRRAVRMQTPMAVDLGFGYRSAAIVPDGVAADAEEVDYRPEARPGYRFPHRWMHGGDRRISTLDLVGPHFTLFHGGHAAWDRAAAVATATTHAPMRSQSLEHLADEALTGSCGITRSGAVLVRPDGHVAWRVPAAADAAGQLADALRTVISSNAMYRIPETAGAAA